MTPRVSGVQSRIPLLNAQLDMSGAGVEPQSSESYTTYRKCDISASINSCIIEKAEKYFFIK